jgi:ABC-2 type transport system ATP-binding protein
MSAGIATQVLGKRFGSVWALRDCTIDVPEGAVAGLVGGNGAGKTTLLRMLAGLSRPSAGRASVAACEPADDERFLGRIGYLAQEVPLYRRWTAADHLAMAAHLNRRWDDAVARERLLSLEIPLDRHVESLSGGMRAQLALALALGKRPEVLLLDEPLAALDPFARQEFMGTLASAITDRPVTVLLSSHLLPDLERVCDHLVLLDRSRTVLCEPIEDLVASHRVVAAPASALEVLGRDHVVVSQQGGGREVSAVVRLGRSVIDPRWRVDDARLEEIVLAYLGRGARGVSAPDLAAVVR